jgi:lipopolysaccharide biosynthesis regulator YciM
MTKKNILFNNSYLLILIQEMKFKEAAEKSISFIKNKYSNDKTVLFFYYSSIFSGAIINFAVHYRELRMIFSKNPMFIEATAQYYYRHNHSLKAIEYFYKLHCMIPSDEHTLSKLIELLEKGNYKKEAVYYTEKMFESNPQNENTAFYYSYFLVKKGDFEKAVKILKTIKNEQAKSCYLLSDIYLKQKDNKRGFYYLKKSFEHNPLYLPIQFKSFMYFYKNMNFMQCLRICKLIEYTNPVFRRVLIYEAMVYIRKNRFDLAINRLEKYLVEFKKLHNPYIKFILSCCYFSAGMTAQTKKIILHMLKENKNQAPYLVMLALCYKRNYNYSELNKIEKVLGANYKNSPTFLEYKSKYIDVENKYSYKRNDIGISIP